MFQGSRKFARNFGMNPWKTEIPDFITNWIFILKWGLKLLTFYLHSRSFAFGQQFEYFI